MQKKKTKIIVWDYLRTKCFSALHLTLFRWSFFCYLKSSYRNRWLKLSQLGFVLITYIPKLIVNIYVRREIIQATINVLWWKTNFRMFWVELWTILKRVNFILPSPYWFSSFIIGVFNVKTLEDYFVTCAM